MYLAPIIIDYIGNFDLYNHYPGFYFLKTLKLFQPGIRKLPGSSLFKIYYFSQKKSWGGSVLSDLNIKIYGCDERIWTDVLVCRFFLFEMN